MSGSELAKGDSPDRSIVAIMPLYNGARWVEVAISSVTFDRIKPVVER
jgi:hypothetical protein